MGDAGTRITSPKAVEAFCVQYAVILAAGVQVQLTSSKQTACTSKRRKEEMAPGLTVLSSVAGALCLLGLCFEQLLAEAQKQTS